MYITLEKINQYCPPSLPTLPRPLQHASPPNLSNPLRSHVPTSQANNCPNLPLGLYSCPSSLPPVQPLHHPLPPRPPVTTTLDCCSASGSVRPDLVESGTIGDPNVFPNEFDQALHQLVDKTTATGLGSDLPSDILLSEQGKMASEEDMSTSTAEAGLRGIQGPLVPRRHAQGVILTAVQSLIVVS